MSAYTERLSRLWTDHLEPKSRTCVSLFAGCGGSSLGMSAAGFEERLAVEWEPHACEQLRRNFPHAEVVEGDVTQLSAEDALRLARVEPGELDLLDGSPPCQGFSTANKSARKFGLESLLKDPRNFLFREHLRLLDAFRPKALIMENVAAMTRGKARFVFRAIIEGMRERGYVVKAWPLLATFYGVPQTRERVIFIGFREDLGIVPEAPRPTVEHALTVAEAWEDMVNDPEEVAALLESGAGRKTLRRFWRQLKPGEFVKDLRVRSRRKVLAKKHAGQKPPADPRASFYCFNYYRVSTRRPMVTITKQWINFWHPDEPRSLTVREESRLQSFPDEYTWIGSRDACRERIGNSVPPLMMEAVARQVRKQLDVAAET